VSYECKSSVERTYLLALNDALQDPNFCNQCKPWKLGALNVLLKTFTQLVDARKKHIAQTHLIHYGPKAQDTWLVLPEIVAFKDLLTVDKGYPSSLGSSFVIEIQAHARRIGLERFC